MERKYISIDGRRRSSRDGGGGSWVEEEEGLLLLCFMVVVAVLGNVGASCIDLLLLSYFLSALLVLGRYIHSGRLW